MVEITDLHSPSLSRAPGSHNLQSPEEVPIQDVQLMYSGN